jgi:hypothetical protein
MNKNHIFRLLWEISKSDELNEHNAFVFMIIAHGNNQNEILDFDGERIKIRELMDFMHPNNCPKLKNKPRYILFQLLSNR